MENNNNNHQYSSFWQFSDQLRIDTNNFSNLSINNDNNSIWSNSYASSKRPEDRRNFDFRIPEKVNPSNTAFNSPSSDRSSRFNDEFKIGSAQNMAGVGLNGGFNKGVYSNPSMNFNFNNNNSMDNFPISSKNYRSGNGKGEVDHFKNNSNNQYGGKNGKKNKNVKKENNNSNSNGNGEKNSVDKRFKTLPPSESLPRNETVGGYIFVCNNDTMDENLKRQLFGLPPRYRDSVRQITPGLPLFLYNYSNHQLHGVFEAASFGGTNIDPTAWEDKKNPGESRFPAQIRVKTRKVCEPLEEDSFRPILHHYDGPKFRLELNIPEAISLLDIFEENMPLKSTQNTNTNTI
ncbi:hypothetical protein LguiB_028968 [Lonicera macranthoides]